MLGDAEVVGNEGSTRVVPTVDFGFKEVGRVGGMVIAGAVTTL